MANVILNIKIHIRKEGALIHSLLPIGTINLAHPSDLFYPSFLFSSLCLFSSFSFFPLIRKSKVDLKNLIIPSPSAYSET